MAPPDIIQPKSLAHTYPRFQLNEYNVVFQVLPSSDCHIDCRPINFVRSHNGLPYPRLDVYIQSLIDTNDRGALSDIIDGTDVTEDWGNENLDLTGTVDAAWREWKNDAICAQKEDLWNFLGLLETRVAPRREIWEDNIRGKESRLSYKQPKELFATRVRLHGSQDPWLAIRAAA